MFAYQNIEYHGKRNNKVIPFFMILLFVIFILRCSDYNPFRDESNARGVIRTTIVNGDVLEIFDTDTLEVIFLVRNLLEKCSLHVDKNRFFEDTCIDFNNTDVFKFCVSFYDTGNHQIKLISVRESGETIEQCINVYAKSPLFQTDIRASAGDSVYLEAIGVKDKDVFYDWNFGDGSDVRSQAIPKKRIYLSGMTKVNCFFKVSDRKGNNSPIDTFSCILEDQKAPEISCLNEVVNDTITVSDSSFYFKVMVKDQGNISEVLMNNQHAVDYSVFRDSTEFIWMINRVDTLKKPMQLNVIAKDEGSNSSNKSFWLCYNPDAQANYSVKLKIKSPTSLAHDFTTYMVKRTPFLMSGELINFSGQLDTMNLYVNDKYVGKWNFRGKYSGDWNFNISIDKDPQSSNKINLLLKDIHGNTIIDSVFKVIYNPSIDDSLPPIIVELSVNGKVLNEDELLVVDKSPVPLRIIAFDEGDGIRNVLLNSNIIHQSDSVSYIWDTMIYSELRTRIYNVDIIDSANLSKSRSFQLKLNHRPQLSNDFNTHFTAGVGKEYNGFIHASDIDGERIFYKVKDGPKTFHIDSLTGDFTWIPVIQDTAISKIFISYNDNHWKDMVCTLNVIVADTNRISQTIRFATSVSDFPDELIADSQELRISLKTTPDIDSKRLRFNLHTDNPGIKITDGLLTWTPGVNDTGVYKILVTATDIISNSSASLTTNIRVIDKTKIIRLLLDYKGKKIDGNTYDLSDPSLTDTLSIVIHGLDTTASDSHSIFITLSGRTELKRLDKNRTQFMLDAMKKSTGYDTLYISFLERNRTYKEKRIIYYGKAPYKPFINEPINGQTITKSLYTIKWAGGDSDEINQVKYSLYLAKEAEEFYLIDSGITNLSYSAEFNKVCNYHCKIVAFDGKASTESDIITVYAEPDNSVRFKNTLYEFPVFLETGKFWTLKLGPQTGTGKRPFVYQIASSGKSIPEITADSSNKDFADIEWNPSLSDTGIYKLQITLSDSFHNKDILEPTIRIVPPNRPATLKSSFTDTILDMRESLQSETLNFTIEDPDDPAIGVYSVNVKFSNSVDVMLVGQNRYFDVSVEPLKDIKVDTLRVELYDRGDSVGIYILPIIYSD